MGGGEGTDLVTGATGFVGSHLVRALRLRGRAVRALVRPGTEAEHLERLGVEVVPGDVTDADGYAAAAAGAQRVFHVAGFVAFLREERTRLEEVNVGGVRNAVEAAREGGAGTLVVTSSVAAVGGGEGTGEVDETQAWQADDSLGYASTKRAGEEVALAASRRGLRVVVVNPAIVLGPGDPRPSAGGDYVLRAAAGRIPFCVRMLQSLVDVRDVAEGHILAAEKGKPGQRYILSAGALWMADFVAAVRAEAGNPGRPLVLPRWVLPPVAALAEWWAARRGEPAVVTREQARMARRQGAFSGARARRELGWKPRPLPETIRDSVGWFADRGMF